MENEDEWMDITSIVSVHEEQINIRTGKHRHRETMPPPGMRKSLIVNQEHRYEGPWIPGPAPKR